MQTTQIAIIGAGVHGASALFHLASRGLKPVILDRGGPAGGPTGRSSAICRAYYTNDFLARVARESMLIFQDFGAATNGRDAGFHKTGMLYLHGAEDGPALLTTVPKLRSLGTAVDLLNRQELAVEFPPFNLEGIAYGAFERDAGHADPVSTTTGLIDRAVELGAVTRFYCGVAEILTRNGGGAILLGEDGSRVECERLLITGGPWTKRLAAQCGVDLPLTAERHVVATYRWAGATRLPYGFADIVGEHYVRPEGNELFLAGVLHPEPTVDEDRYSTAISQAEIGDLSSSIMTRVPSLQAAESTGGWASLYDVSPDWQPVIGQIADGVFVDAGTSGHGFKLAPALGRYVAGLVLGEDVDSRIGQFTPLRFRTGSALAAGYGSARILG